MKKKMILLSLIVSFMSLNIGQYNTLYALSVDYSLSSYISLTENNTILIPGGPNDYFINGQTNVIYIKDNVVTPNGSSVEVFSAVDDADESTKQYLNSMINATNYPNAVCISSASVKYNCHSYAWYDQSTSNDYWMNSPSAYYTDGSYVETSSPLIGDIICYYNSSGTNLHSGVIGSFTNEVSNNVCDDSNLYVVVSKWGKAGVYEHRGDQCPYTSYGGGNAVSVKYYHRHIFSWVYNNTTTHREICDCGYSNGNTEIHAVRYADANDGDGKATCVGCNHILNLNKDQAVIMSKQMVTKNGSYISSEGIYIITDEDIENYFNSSLVFYIKKDDESVF